MALDLESVIKQLTDSSIIAQGKLEKFIPPNAHPKNGDELVQELVKSQELTKFQAAQIKAGKAKALILGEYTILDKIGAGGMGQVFKAQHRRMKRLVAIKMLPPAMTKDPLALARFQREVEAAAKLSHQNIVHANDAGQVGAAHFLVMEYVDGKDLSATVKQDGPLPVNKAVNYILQAARGLEYAHSEGIVHRDIKPANLLLDKKGVLKILDMGLARIDQADGPAQAELTGTGTIMGTIDYMSPEQAVNTKHADARSDIYSLGISLYYLLAGKAAYAGDTAMEKLMAHQNQPIPSLQDVQSTVSKQLDAIFKKMVAKKVEQRYQTTSEVVDALESLGYGGSGILKKGEVASTLDLSSADKKMLASKTKKKPLGSITEVVASEKSKNLLLKIVGGSFGTIIAPILVFYLIRHLDKPEQPANPPAATTPAATVQPVAAATTAKPSAPPTKPTKPWETPEFQKWIADTQKLPAELQIEAVSKKLMEVNPGFDGKIVGGDNKTPPLVKNGEVLGVGLFSDNVADLSPIRAFSGLKSLVCPGTNTLRCRLSDLSPLAEMKLLVLNVTNTQVADLSPLQVMPLTVLGCDSTLVSDLSPLVNCKDLKTLGVKSTKVTPASVAAVQKALPNCNIIWDDPAKVTAKKLAYRDPAFQKWVADTQKLPAERQIEAVSKKLMELNPGFDGMLGGFTHKSAPKIEQAVVIEFGFAATKAMDISPVRALSGLKRLALDPKSGSGFSDLSPLQGMNLSALSCSRTKVVDLSPLAGMPLTSLLCDHTLVSDLSPLAGAPLRSLHCIGTPIVDLGPLEKCALLDLLDIKQTKVTPAQVAALQKALPNCKIQWDGDAKPAAGSGKEAVSAKKLAYLDPAFQQWVAGTRMLPAEQ